MMREIDPEGVRQCKAHRLVRHRYYAQGPYYVWHVDGYDKLKPYGFCFNGALIDGYSRRILWLEASNSNNSSGVIAKYYLDALANLGVCPRPLRCDRRTDNAKLSVLQPFFRYNDMDSFSGMKSFMYGNSVSNQSRIVVGEYLEDKEYSGECVTSRICKIRVHSMKQTMCMLNACITALWK